MEEIVSNDASNNSDQVEKDLEWGLANVENVATSRCMYKVPQILYDANKEAYTPKVISIGPYHCGRKNFLSMHSLKMRFLRSFLERTGLELGTCVKMARGWEEEVRGYYDDECGGLNSDEFVQMILMDGIFILEFTWLWSNESNQGSDGLLMEDASLKDDIIRDLMLLENQLPFFVLQGLCHQSSLPGDGDGDGHDHLWLSYLTKIFVDHFDLMPLSDSNDAQWRRMHFLIDSNIMHLVDVIHVIICIKYYSFQDRKRIYERHTNYVTAQEKRWRTDERLPEYVTAQEKRWPEPVTFQGPNKLELSRSATELQEAGVKLVCAKSEYKQGPDLILTSIAFTEKNGVLLIPHLVVNRNTESLFRNIIAYEQCHRKHNKFRSYVILMDCLINTSHDVQLLVDSGIIDNCLGEIEDVCTLFNNLYKMPMMDSSKFHFMELCRRLNEYSKDPWHKWKATWFRWKLILGRDYFNSPWSIFSVVAAIILLGLTIIQTLCSIKGVKW